MTRLAPRLKLQKVVLTTGSNKTGNVLVKIYIASNSDSSTNTRNIKHEYI